MSLLVSFPLDRSATEAIAIAGPNANILTAMLVTVGSAYARAAFSLDSSVHFLANPVLKQTNYAGAVFVINVTNGTAAPIAMTSNGDGLVTVAANSPHALIGASQSVDLTVIGSGGGAWVFF